MFWPFCKVLPRYFARGLQFYEKFYYDRWTLLQFLWWFLKPYFQNQIDIINQDKWLSKYLDISNIKYNLVLWLFTFLLLLFLINLFSLLSLSLLFVEQIFYNLMFKLLINKPTERNRKSFPFNIHQTFMETLKMWTGIFIRILFL